MFIISLILIGIRSIFFGIASTVSLAIVVQAVAGMFFPALWSAGVAYAYENAPAQLKATAQGVFGAASFGIGSAVGGLISGLLLENLGGRGMFLVLGIIMLAGLGLVEGAKRVFPDNGLAKADL